MLSEPLLGASPRGGLLVSTLGSHQLTLDSGREIEDAGMEPCILSASEMDLLTPGSENRKPVTAVFARHLYLVPVSPEGVKTTDF